MVAPKLPSPVALKKDPSRSPVFALVKTGWQMQGTSWHAPGDGWLVAHDLYHHEPDDRGTFAEELMSFGVQEWLESAGQSPLARQRARIDFENAVCYVLMESKGKLDLPAPPPWPDALGDAVRRYWEEAYAGGVDSLVMVQQQRLSDPAWAPVEAPDHVSRAVGWMAEGWRRAQQRYPSPERTQAAFEHLEHAMNAARVNQPLGTCLAVTWHPDTDCTLAVVTDPVNRPRRRWR